MKEKLRRKKQNHIFAYLLPILLSFLLTGCSGQSEAAADDVAWVEKENLYLVLPEGYTESTTSGLYLNTEYPDDQSNIFLYTTEKDENFTGIMQGGQQEFVEYLAAAYEAQYEERPEITVLQYQQTKVGEYDAYVIELTYSLQGAAYDQLEYIIDAEKTYYVAFSQVGAHTWMDAFRESAATMYFAAQ